MPARVRMRWTAYAGVSVLLAGGVIVKALAQRPNFYSAAVYLSQSSANLMILTNLTFVTVCTLLFGLQKLLYGPLRPIEIEQLYEKAWFAVTETCLAMTIFRGEVGPWFLIMFFSLLAGKVWGWIGEGRVEILEQQPPRDPRLFHTRLALSLGLSFVFDLSMLQYIFTQVMRMAKPDMMVMFGFEFAVLTIISLSTALRYVINLIEIGIVRGQKRLRGEEMRKERVEAARERLETAERQASQNADQQMEQPAVPISVDDARRGLERAEQPVDENEIEVEGWENKGRWTFYLDLATDFCKLVTYLAFFFILLVFYGLPIHIMRDVFLTTRSFFKRIADFMKYRTATRDMNERYPDATAEDIGREDVCIICREEMRAYQPPAAGQQTNPAVERMRPKRLPCGHVLHFACLRSWLERQQVCPTCRRSVVPAPAGGNIGTVAPAAAAGAPGQPAQHPPADRQGPRIFQFGPLRIGVGAARGNNMFEQMQQQLVNGQAPAAVPGNQNGPQQYGFGIRWEGRRRNRQRPREVGSIREQLDSVEQQIQQEMQALTQSTREFAVLRAMQTELDRVRLAGSNAPPAAAAATGIGAQPPGGMPLPALRPAQILQAAPGARVVEAGSEQLPPGLTLPEGWTMMPLHPAGPPQVAGQVPVPAGAQLGQQPPPPPSAFPGSTPENIRAMFSNMPGQTVHNATATNQPPTATPTASLSNGSSSTRSNSAQTGTPSSQEATNGDTSTRNAVPEVNGHDAHQETTEQTTSQDSTSQPLPSWGSQEESRDNDKGKQREDPSGSGTETTSDVSDAVDTGSKQAMVEDAVDDLD